MSGRNAIAFSNRRLPMKHQGHTTSETISIGREHGLPQHVRDPACEEMRAAQVRLGERCKDRSVLFAVREIHVAHEPAEKPCGIDIGATVDHAVEGKARNSQRRATLLAFLHSTLEVAPKRL